MIPTTRRITGGNYKGEFSCKKCNSVSTTKQGLYAHMYWNHGYIGKRRRRIGGLPLTSNQHVSLFEQAVAAIKKRDDEIAALKQEIIKATEQIRDLTQEIQEELIEYKRHEEEQKIPEDLVRWVSWPLHISAKAARTLATHGKLGKNRVEQLAIACLVREQVNRRKTE